MSFDTKWWTTGRRQIHLIGVSGSGMTPLAEILMDLGHEVSGSDLKEIPERLKKRGMVVALGHDAESIGSAEVVVASAAIPDSNAEWVEAKRRGMARVRRSEVLAKLAGARKLVAVLGSHGKTTTATMLAQIFREAGQDPSFYLGGYAPSLGASGAWRKGEWLIAEVDESEGAPTELLSWAALLLNADHEHADRYLDGAAVIQAYGKVLGQVAGGCVVVARDEKEAMAAAEKISTKVTFG